MSPRPPHSTSLWSAHTANNETSIADRIIKTGHALTVRDLAEILNVSRAFVYRLAADGTIPTIRVGAAVRFDPASVAAWLRKDAREQH